MNLAAACAGGMPCAYKGKRSLRSAARFRAWSAWYSHRGICIAAIAAMLAIAACAASLAMAAAAPQAAYADGIADVLTAPGRWLQQQFGEAVSGFWTTILQAEFEVGGAMLDQISLGQVSSNFNEIFANSGAYDIVRSVHGTIVNGLAYSVLAIVFLVQTVRIANKIDGNQAVPGVKEMIFLLIFFCIGKYIIDNSLLFCEAIYNGTSELIRQIDPQATYTHLDLSEQFKNVLIYTPTQMAGEGFVAVVLGLFFIVACGASSAVCYVVVFSRAIQIYLYSILAPIPLALLMCDETRQQAMGFIKNYLSVCFAGFIIVVLLKLFPALMQTAIQDNLEIYSGFICSLAVMFVFILGLVKCGSWARDIFGG